MVAMDCEIVLAVKFVGWHCGSYDLSIPLRGADRSGGIPLLHILESSPTSRAEFIKEDAA